MIIIVEGPDGAGKTTLINQLLISHPGSTKLHFVKPENASQARNYWKIYAKAIEEVDPTTLTIFDRSWYSDLVYGPVMRKQTEMDEMHVRLLESHVVNHGGGFVIYCTAKLDTLWLRCVQRGESYIKDKQQLFEIASMYERIVKTKCSLPVVTNDTTN